MNQKSLIQFTFKMTVFLQRYSSSLSQGFKDKDLRYSPGWWATTVATYCPSRPSQLFTEQPQKNSEEVDGNRMYNNLVGLKTSFVPPFLSGAGRRRRAPDEPDGQGGGPRHCAVRALQQLCKSGARLALVQAPPRPGGPRRGAGPVRLLHEVQGGGCLQITSRF